MSGTKEQLSRQNSVKSEKSDAYEPATRKTCCQKMNQARYMFAFMGFCSFIFNYALRTNLSVAILAMVNHTALETDGPFVWGGTIQGWVLSAFFFGYLLTNLPGGFLSDRFGSKQLLGLGILVSGAATCVTPCAAYCSWQLLFVVRFIIGIALGFSFPAMHSMIARWIPPSERSLFSSIIYSGTGLGMIITSSLTGVIADSVSWEASFYIFGGISIAWWLSWQLLIYDEPEEHPRISAEELDYIKTALLEIKTTRPKVPLRAILTSVPVWALVCTEMSFDWFNFTLTSYLPMYMSDILHYDIVESGVYSGVVYAVLLVTTIVYGIGSDWVIEKGYLSVTAQRKILNTWTMGGAGTVLLVASFITPSPGLGVGIMVIGAMFAGGVYGSHMVNQIDLSPNFAGTILGICNTFSTVAGIVSPIINGNILDEGNTMDQWKKIFIIAAAVLYFGTFMFAVFATGEEQPWNRVKGTLDEEDTSDSESRNEELNQTSLRVEIVEENGCDSQPTSLQETNNGSRGSEEDLYPTVTTKQTSLSSQSSTEDDAMDIIDKNFSFVNQSRSNSRVEDTTNNNDLTVKKVS